MKSRIGILLLLLMIVIGTILTYGGIAVGQRIMIKPAPEINEIQRRGELVVGLYYKDMPPFFMTNDQGKLYGIDIELARDIARVLGVKVKFNREAKTYQQLFELVAQNKVDVVISKFSMTFDRAQVIRYTEPYVTFRRALLVNSTYATKKGIKDYPMDHLRTAKVKVGVRAKTSYVEFANQLFKNAEIVQYEEWKSVVNALKEGEVMAALYDENEVIKSVRKNSNIALFASVYILKDQKDYIAMALPRGSNQLLEWLNFYLKSRKINMSVNDLIDRYPEVYE